ncbi:MAG: hypothetical protein FRX48_03907 [Lasallia pustulata]|uniref:Non-structural maintenance of chromosomes element 1 homolog n=1 Tax=Lasallia pustulata TaxID=136370 RepID=A0A5M8PU40_9LECA|nr:MAG: hypothetical protein FRX48_03907 [Lasallia pustulata]
MSENGDTQYNNSNRAFLQAFLARSTLTYDEAKPILAAILTAHEKRETLPEDMTERDFTSYITAANTALSPFDLEIRSTHHQQTRARIYALVNCTSDPITQLATTHSADEISYLKRVLDGMFETYNTPRHEVMAITSMQAVRLHKLPAEHNSRREAQDGAATQGSAGQGLTMMQGEKVLQTVVEEGWLEKSGRGYYSLSARGLMELRGWLVETYNEAGDEEEDDEEERVVRVKLCFACKEIITVGQRCPKRSCTCRLHDICTQGFFRTQTARKCPLCKTEWTGRDFVGERAVTGEAGSGPGRRRSGGGSTGRRNTQVVAEEAEEAEDVEVEGPGGDEALEGPEEIEEDEDDEA